MITLSRGTIRPGFSAAGLRGHMLPMGHILNVDHFTMSEPTFPPHPHAGFSAVTWMLPWSPGTFTNRDSLGDSSRIGPGALHWTRAGAGMMHEEIPETPGVPGQGLQIFVKLPRGQEHVPPQAFHLEPHEIPAARRGAAEARVLVGGLEGVTSPIPSLSGTTMAHVTVTGGSGRFSLPGDVPAFALALRGEGAVDGQPIRADQAVALGGEAATFSSEGELDVLLAWSPPLPAPVRFQGPLGFFAAADLADGMRRFRAGGMGQLSPSPAFTR